MPFPSADQTTVIAHRGRPLVVVAGPGTGKTTTLVARMIGLLRESQSREVSFVTFTKTSRRDTHKKLEEAFGGTVFTQRNVHFPRTVTLHSYAKSLVHRYAAAIGRSSNFSVLVEKQGEKDLLVQECLDDLGVAADTGRVGRALSCIRANSDWPTDVNIDTEVQARLVEQFESLLVFYRTYDMEGVVLRAAEVLEAVSDQLPPIFLQVDEYQDLNPADQALISQLAAHPDSQVVVVGDDAQSIYGFRSANYEGLRTLWESRDWDHITFKDSERLPAHILNAALALVQDDGYLGAAVNRKPSDGRRILTLQCTKPDLQMQFVARSIRAALQDCATSGQPVSHREFLVLCPTATLVDSALTELQRQQIPAHKSTAPVIEDAVWHVILLLRILGADDPLAFRQWLPRVGLSDTEIRNLRLAAVDQGKHFTHLCFSQNDPRLRSLADTLTALKSAYTDAPSFSRALETVQGLESPRPFVSLMEALLQGSATLPPPDRLVRLCYEALGFGDPGEQSPDDDKVLVATLHAAKGLEAGWVYCPWMNARFMPMSGREPAEQKRVLYVAMTRAKRSLNLLFHEEFDQVASRLRREEAMSPFLRAIRAYLDVRRFAAAALH